MKKKVLSVALFLAMSMNLNAQIYGDESPVVFPSQNLYDMGMMNMYIRSYAETAARRKEMFYRYTDLAEEACRNKQWNYVVYYVNEALETEYYNGYLFFLRGYAYEQIGNLKAAKKDYKRAVKNGYTTAARALEMLNARSKQK